MGETKPKEGNEAITKVIVDYITAKLKEKIDSLNQKPQYERVGVDNKRTSVFRIPNQFPKRLKDMLEWNIYYEPGNSLSTASLNLLYGLETEEIIFEGYMETDIIRPKSPRKAISAVYETLDEIIKEKDEILKANPKAFALQPNPSQPQ